MGRISDEEAGHKMVRTKLWDRNVQIMCLGREMDQPGRADGLLEGAKGDLEFGKRFVR